MKKYVLIILILSISVLLFSLDEFDFNDIPKEVKYCMIHGLSFGIDTPPVITIDFGQKWIAKKAIKKDGKTFLFNSMIDALNWMYQNGWEYVDSYVIMGGFGVKYYYLLKRKE